MSRHAIYNARNTPPCRDLSMVAHDFTQALQEGCGIVAINEAYSKKYKRTIERIAHEHKYGVIWGQGGVGLAFRWSKWICRKWKWRRYFRGIAHFTPERGVLIVTLWNKHAQHLETYYITHMINGAFNKKPLVFKKLRPAMWKKGWGILTEEVSNGTGLRMVLGDINRQAKDTPRPHSHARLRTPRYEIMQIWAIGNWGNGLSWNVPESQLKWTDHRIFITQTTRTNRT